MSTRRFVIRTGADLGRTIAEARTIGGITQSDLAEQVGVDRTYLARLEGGKTTLHLERTLRLLRDLGVTVHAELEFHGE